MVASRLATLEIGANQHVEISTPSQSVAAAMLNVSRESVISARKVLDQGSAELINKVDSGEIAVSTVELSLILLLNYLVCVAFPFPKNHFINFARVIILPERGLQITFHRLFTHPSHALLLSFGLLKHLQKNKRIVSIF